MAVRGTPKSRFYEQLDKEVRDARMAYQFGIPKEQLQAEREAKKAVSSRQVDAVVSQPTGNVIGRQEFNELLRDFNNLCGILIRLISREITEREAEHLLESLLTGVNAG